MKMFFGELRKSKQVSHQILFHRLGFHPLLQVADGVKSLILDRDEFKHDSFKPRLVETERKRPMYATRN